MSIAGLIGIVLLGILGVVLSAIRRSTSTDAERIAADIKILE